MKHPLLFSFLFLSFFSHAQNWEIFNSYDRYNYKLNDSPLITNVLFADSFKLNGTDTIYYLNRIVQKHATSTTYDTVYKNLPQFFQLQVERSPDGVYLFSNNGNYTNFNPNTFVIHAYANPGDSWMYDTVANITATITGDTLQSLFGTMDSVKQITLSNGDSILLSKSFGIIGFPSDTLSAMGLVPVYYTLRGIETRSIGDSVINFNDIYNFNVGDVFMYYDISLGDLDNAIEYEKYTILNKILYVDSIKYIVRSVLSGYIDWGHFVPPASPPGPFPFPAYADTVSVTLVDTFDHVGNSYNSEFIPNLFFFSFESFQNIYYDQDVTQSRKIPGYSSYYFDPVYNLPCKAFIGPYDSFSDTYPHDSIGPDILLMQYWSYSCSICEGIGNAHQYDFDFEAGGSQDLIGYIKNGVQWGTVYADSLISGVTDLSENIPSISVFPNITYDYVNVRVANASNMELRFVVCDLTGKQVLSKELPFSTSKINCSGLPSSIYIWRLTDKNENIIGVGKIAKQ